MSHAAAKAHTREENKSDVRSQMSRGTRVKKETISHPTTTKSKTTTKSPQVTVPRHTGTGDRQQFDRSSDGLIQVMEKQNAITELLVKQQSKAQLPKKEVAVFKGNPLNYRSFIRAFERAIEQKTDNDQDKLYYL